MKTLITLIALAVTPLGWTRMSPSNPAITEADAGRTIAYRRGATITVSLANPATGGYDIVTELFDPQVLQLLARNEVAPQSTPIPRLGDFGKIVFEFKTIGTGETDVVIQVARRWEALSTTKEYFRVRIRVMD